MNLPLGADEVGTWKSYINVDHNAKERHSAKHFFKRALRGEDWREFT